MQASGMGPTVFIPNVLIGTQNGAAKNPRAVVFVHGFGGDIETTWQDKKGSSFPALMRAHPELQEWDVFQFGYRSSLKGGRPVDEIAAQLDDAIDKHLKEYQIVLLAHSMGGLVAMEYILSRLRGNKPLAVVGLITYGTPTAGVGWINFVKNVSKVSAFASKSAHILSEAFSLNKQLNDMERDSAFLQELYAEWILRIVNGGYPTVDAKQRAWIAVRAVTGTYDQVVSESSAKGAYGLIDWKIVDLNHTNLVKPGSQDDLSFQHASEFLKQCRSLKPPETVRKLRNQVDWVWERHQDKLIRNWHFELEFSAPGDPQLPKASAWAGGEKFGLPGFSLFRVKCSYILVLPAALDFGVALGRTSSNRAFHPDTAYLHKLYVEALPAKDLQAVSKAIQDKMNDPDAAWRSFFDGPPSLSVGAPGGRKRFDLSYGKVRRSGDALLGSYSVPAQASQLVGQEAVLEVSFTSLRPDHLDQFTVECPWLCDGMDIEVTVKGRTDYLVARPAIKGATSLELPEAEDLGTLRRRTAKTRDLVLPDSTIQFEWRPSSVVG